MISSIEEGRKQDGNRSIADKILKRLHDLEKTIENNQGRWAWELLQNAKDSMLDDQKKVNIRLIRREDEIVFSHNGNHFTEYDIRGLINQISSKEVEDGQKATRVGRFGTGFITTHLLSKEVIVKGILETRDKETYQYQFKLNRDGTTTSALAPKIEDTWTDFHNSTQRIYTIDPNELNTSFTYVLTNDKQRIIAQRGIEEFIRLMPYVLAFNHKIGKVTIINGSQSMVMERDDKVINEIIIPINKIEGGYPQQIQIALRNEQGVAVALEIDPSTNSAKDLKNIPKLFCDFPLIGTEKFYFPVVVNSFHFNPQTERDGIWLKGDDDNEVLENRNILVQSIEIYKKLLISLSSDGVRKLYYAATTKMPEINESYFDRDWYETQIQKPLRDIILRIPLIDTKSYGRQAIESYEGVCVDFPYHSKKEICEKLWELGLKLNRIPIILPEKESIEFWIDVIWDKKYYLTFEKLAKYVASRSENISSFEMILGFNQDPFDWLNEYYSLLIQEGESQILNNYKIVPNQNNNLKLIPSNQYFNEDLRIDEIGDENLLKIIKLLGSDWKERLIHSKVNIRLTNDVLSKENIASSIYHIFENNKYSWNDNIKEAFIILSEWFENNPENGLKLFPELYRTKAELFMRIINDKDSLYSIMKSKTSLSILSEVALAIENDPEILDIIKQRQRELMEEKQRNRIGEHVESILAEVLRDFGFSVAKAHVGRDLIITLSGKFNYDIEVKSTSYGNYVSMTPTQARTAVSKPGNYALCVVHCGDQPLTKEFVAANCRFVTNIGSLITERVNAMSNFENTLYSFSTQTNLNNIGLLFENSLNYKYKIYKDTWSMGYDIRAFINYINH